MRPPVAYFGGPPYLGTTRSSFNDANGWSRRPAGDYAVEFQTEAQHRELAGVLGVARAAVLISGYPSDLYEDLYAGWWRVERQVLCRASNGRTGKNFHRTEVIWSNRPLAPMPDVVRAEPLFEYAAGGA